MAASYGGQDIAARRAVGRLHGNDVGLIRLSGALEPPRLGIGVQVGHHRAAHRRGGGERRTTCVGRVCNFES